jgi:hypothetical protein
MVRENLRDINAYIKRGGKRTEHLGQMTPNRSKLGTWKILVVKAIQRGKGAGSEMTLLFFVIKLIAAKRNVHKR